jgi:hypothetical protein
MQIIFNFATLFFQMGVCQIVAFAHFPFLGLTPCPAYPAKEKGSG